MNVTAVWWFSLGLARREIQKQTQRLTEAVDFGVEADEGFVEET